MRKYFKRKWNRFKKLVSEKYDEFKESRFLLGCVFLAIGMSLMICLYEGKSLYQDYTEAMGYWELYNKGVRASASAEALDTPQEEAGDPVSLSPEEEIREIAKRENFEDADLLVRIAQCESGLIPDRRSDVKTSSALGLFQILNMHQLTEAERCDVDISTTWTINKIKSGGLNAWNASRHCWSI